MASVLFGVGVAQMRGSVGGVVFSRNHFGAYTRNRVTPINPNTARQVVVRAALAFLTARWSETVTQIQRDAWDLYGANVQMLNRLGQAIFLTGFNHYLRSNIILKSQGLALVDAGPVIFELPAQDPTFKLSASAGTQLITFTFDDTMTWTSEDDAHLFLFQGQPQNAQRIFFDGPWRFIGELAGDVAIPITSPRDIAPAFTISEGQRQFAYARIQRADGRLSSPFRDNDIVGA